MNMNRLLSPEIFVFLIPIVGIIVWGVVAIVRQVIQHRERQALIDQGIHPDYPPGDESRSDLPPKRSYR